MRNLTEQEFDIKYQMYKDLIYNIAYTYVHNSEDATDISQEVFIKYLQNEIEFETDDNEKYWLIRVTINISKNVVTSSWKKKTILDEELVNRKEEDNASYDIEKEKYYNVITNLALKYREPIVLFYYENLKIEEIANVLKVSISCVKKRLERGREKIKEEIQKWKN